MATIQVAPVPKKKVKALDLLAELCYFYPQYTLAEARRLPAKDVLLLLKVAHKKKAEEYLNLTQIAAAPHTRKGAGVKKLSTRYSRVATDGK
jgi:hypothetical protein